jgi:membrane protein DedA with SNARE-associated domain/rhodanese-related sulfurtransferase
MDALLGALAQHGYSILFLLVFAEAIGLPVPAAIALLTAGGLSAKGTLHAAPAFSSAAAAMFIADTVMFLMGRYTGWWLLGLLCRISLNPEACILRSAQRFHRRGRVLLLIAKFIPGVNTMAPPMAGSMNMSYWQFVTLDSVGLLLYIGAYFGAGVLFSDVLGPLTSRYQQIGTVFGWGAAALAATYVVRRLVLWFRLRSESPVLRISPDDAARTEGVAIFDVRSHGYYTANAQRIEGSRRLDPNALPVGIDQLQQLDKIVLYCTCIREATSTRVARILREHGIEASVLDGGLKAWKKAGLPMEPIPQAELLSMPTFA